MWTRDEAFALARVVEDVAPEFGAHVALTGGLLYKDGPRKDADLVIYRIRQTERIDEEGLFAALASRGLTKTADFGFVKKGCLDGKSIDFLFPEAPPSQRTYPTALPL